MASILASWPNGPLYFGQTHTFSSHHNEETCSVCLLYAEYHAGCLGYKKADDRPLTLGATMELEKKYINVYVYIYI